MTRYHVIIEMPDETEITLLITTDKAEAEALARLAGPANRASIWEETEAERERVLECHR
jgi:uncharacterized protein (DUF2252 family)